MTYRTHEAPRREVISRWCSLAEQRLEYLTEMFESGRWRRFYSEAAFLENIKEAKFAVETWRSLSMPALAQGIAAVELALSSPATMTSAPPLEASADVAIVPEPLATDGASEVVELDEPGSDLVVDMSALEQALDVPQTLDLAGIEHRYPLLRNTL